MAIYMTDRSLPGATLEQLAAMQKAAIETSQRYSAAGTPVRYIRSVWVPSEAHEICLFEAASAELVRSVNEAANIPFNRIVEAMDLTP